MISIQSVCLVLWSKFESFRPGSSFFAWARQTAKIKVSDFLRHKRSPAYVTEKLMDILTEIADEPRNDEAEAYLVALRRCREKLSATDDELLQLRYVEELSTVEIADRLQRLQPSVSRSLNRIRRWLFECIEMEVAKQEHSSKETLMSDHAIDLDRLFDLVGTVCDEDASQDELVELDSIMLVDREACRRYLGYCRMHSALRLELRAHRAAQAVYQQIGITPSRCRIERIPCARPSRPSPPSPAFLPTTLHGTIGSSPRAGRWRT